MKLSSNISDLIQCRVCNKWFKQITSGHLLTHNLTVDEYKEKYNIKLLVSESTHKCRSKSKIGNNCGYKLQINKWMKQHQNKHFCACGCGEVIKIRRGHFNSGIPKYIKNHQTIGRFVSAKERKMRSESWTDEMRKSAQKRQIIRVSNDDYIEYLRECGKNQFSISNAREEMSKIKIEYYKNHPEAREAARIRAINQKHNTCNTSIELKMQDILMFHGYIFELQQPCCNICLPDILFPKEKIAIFCDGDYWHNYPKGTNKDKNQDKILLENGWIPLRFWEHEINENIEDCLYRFELEYLLLIK